MKKIFISSLIVSSSLFGGIETNYFKELQELDKELTNINNTKEKLDIINPINFSYNNDFKNDSEYYTISFSQDIFRSGGIFHSISYSNKVKELNLKNLNLKEQNNLLDTYILIKRIQLIDLNIEKTKLSLKNKEIEYKTKDELYKNGLTDIFTVNDLVISIESLQNSLIDLEMSKEEIINTLKSFTYLKYTDIEVNHLPFPSKKDFIESNIVNLDKLNIGILEKQKDLINSQYLPKLSIYASTTDYLNSNTDRYNSFGIRASMGLHPNMYYNNEVSKLKILKSKVSLSEKIINMKNLYTLNSNNMDLLSKKENNFNTIIKTLDNKLESIQQDIDLGNTTQYTFDILNNTKKQYEIDKVKLKIEKDILILSLRKNMI